MSLDTRERLKFTVLTARARESVRNRLDVALIQQPGAKKFVGKKVGVSPRHGGEARNREG